MSEQITLTEGHHFENAKVNGDGEVILQLGAEHRDRLEQTFQTVFDGRDDYSAGDRGDTPDTDISQKISDIVSGHTEELESRDRCPECNGSVEVESESPLEEYCLECDYYRAKGGDGGVIRE